MSNPQYKVEDQVLATESAGAHAGEPMDLFPDDNKMLISPARALQAKLVNELQPVKTFEAEHPVLMGLAVFATACAGTWVFGALLYMQF